MKKEIKKPSLQDSELYAEKFISRKERISTIVLLVLFSLVCLVILPFSLYFQNTYISVEVRGASMYSTLENKDVIYMNIHRPPKRGDIVVVDVTKYKENANFSGDYIVKRVVAQSGDSLYATNGKVYIRYEGETEFVPLNETYLSPSVSTDDFAQVDVGEGMLFLMGDNRTNSYDSRNVGAFADEDVIAVATEFSYNFKEVSTFLYWLFKPQK